MKLNYNKREFLNLNFERQYKYTNRSNNSYSEKSPPYKEWTVRERVENKESEIVC